MFFTGIQYDLVLSIATLEQCSWMSHLPPLQFRHGGSECPCSEFSFLACWTRDESYSQFSLAEHRFRRTARFHHLFAPSFCKAGSRRIVYTLPLGLMKSASTGSISASRIWLTNGMLNFQKEQQSSLVRGPIRLTTEKQNRGSDK